MDSRLRKQEEQRHRGGFLLRIDVRHLATTTTISSLCLLQSAHTLCKSECGGDNSQL